MTLKEAATTATMFTQPTLWAEFDERDKEAEDALYNLKKMKMDKKKLNSRKYLEKILFMKYRMF